MVGRLYPLKKLKKVCQFKLTVLTLSVFCLYAAPVKKLDSALITQTIESQYGERAGKRIRAWFKILDEARICKIAIKF